MDERKRRGLAHLLLIMFKHRKYSALPFVATD
jgi:hypothetical protein